MIKVRYYDIINKRLEDGRNGDEIAAELIARAGLELA